MSNPLLDLKAQSQSVWLDFITRQFIADGKLAKLIQDDGLTGVTSNPTIFQKAITGGKEYDETIAAQIREGKNSHDIFDGLAVEDIQKACDAFKEVYEKTKGLDGYVSLEVSPHLARDAQATLSDARRLFKTVARPNVMIKIPGTQECLSAIEQALGDGININVTLIFSLERYQAVMTAWLAGLERLDKAGKPLSSVASVASFFVSRVDTLIDGRLEKEKPAGWETLQGKAAISNAVLAYDLFLKMKASARFQALAAKGAKVQRPLWASTGTKNPKYSDVLYVEELIGSETVNTLPLATIDAFRDHGKARKALPRDSAQAQKNIDDLAKAGISMKAVTDQLEVDGLKLFTESFDDLMKALDKKKDALQAGVR